MKIGHHRRRLLVALVIPFVLVAACGNGSEDVPDDQSLQPAAAPSGWVSTELDLVSLAAPPEWTKAGTTTPEEGITVTTWRTEPVDGRSSGGMEVREIAEPTYSAEEAAEGLAVNAMATMKGDKPAPDEITWPNATDAWLFVNDITAGTAADSTQAYVSSTFVADLADGSQLQITVVTAKGEDDELGQKVLSTVELNQVDE